MAVFDREHHYRDLLAKQVGGRTEVTLPFGRADVMTDTMVWEVEPAARYPEGVRQAIQYAVQTGLPAALAAYGPTGLVTKVFDHLAKLPAPGVELWWLHAGVFMPVKSTEEAEILAAEPPSYLEGSAAPERVGGDPCRNRPAHVCTVYKPTAARDLKMADDLALTLERLAWPHVDPSSRDVIAAYLREVRSVIWHEAAGQPDYAKVWNDPDDGKG